MGAFWNWLWDTSPKERFVDLNLGIFYEGHGEARSMKGLFRNFDLPERNKNLENEEAMKILANLVESGKISKKDLIEYSQNRKLIGER